MSTTLHSFMDIFETTIEDGDISVQLNKIVIPQIASVSWTPAR